MPDPKKVAGGHLVCGPHVLFCQGKHCRREGARDSLRAFKEELKALGCREQVKITKTHCNGRCEAGPVVIAYPEGCYLLEMTRKNSKALARQYAACFLDQETDSEPSNSAEQ